MAENDTFCSTRVAADIMCEFMEVAIHTVLYMRGIYPSRVFSKRKKYNVPVQICQHPDVLKYVENIVEGMKCLLSENEMEKVVIVVTGEKQKPLERFVFDIAPSGQAGTQSDKYLFRLESSLRGFLLKLNVCDAMLTPASQEKTWTVHIHTKESAAAKLEQKALTQNFPWVEVDEDQLTLQKPNLVPLKATTSDLIKMQLYVEEASNKVEASNKDTG
ncbi:mitotic spindle assembly checkpoint protein MAD2B-like [Liolophura sinensis]|uniref:mitotic spindle assembly checkpoint protein MAD2B-like n=1 Tax=Liolophura sinensis TaxID=3198878 RepID=UPI003158D6DB